MKTYAWIAFLTKIILLLLLMGFLSLPFFTGNPLAVLQQIEEQRAREATLAKDTLVLADVHDASLQINAQAEFQSTLILWQKTQNGIANGDASLSLSGNLPESVSTFYSHASTFYTQLLPAYDQVLNHHNPADSVQVQIILRNDQPYRNALSDVEVVYLQELIVQWLRLYFLELGIVLAIGAVATLNFYFLVRR